MISEYTTAKGIYYHPRHTIDCKKSAQISHLTPKINKIQKTKIHWWNKESIQRCWTRFYYEYLHLIRSCKWGFKCQSRLKLLHLAWCSRKYWLLKLNPKGELLFSTWTKHQLSITNTFFRLCHFMSTWSARHHGYKGIERSKLYYWACHNKI